MANEIGLTTFGMLILDEIHFSSSEPPVFNIMGGAGSYVAMGARLLSPPPHSKSIGWIVDAGSDFPTEVRDIIAGWDTSCMLRETPNRLTTRGWNLYQEHQKRDFKYKTEKLQIDVNSLDETLLASKCFHIICYPIRFIEQAQGIIERRKKTGRPKPLLIWEPMPPSCIPNELGNFLKAIKYVDILSPNHSELCGLFGQDGDISPDGINTLAIEECCKALLDSGIGENGQGIIVVRAGPAGCLVASNEGNRWMPAYHTSPSDVVDPTGGGNAFLGGFAIFLVHHNTSSSLKLYEEAAAWGTVAASFAIEQVGMPTLKREGEKEAWNGMNVFDRLDEYEQRLKN